MVNEINKLGQRLVTFIHEDGSDIVVVMPEYNQFWLNQMRQNAGAKGLELILNPTFKSKNGHWSLDEIDALQSLIVFKEKEKLKTSYGSETFKDEGLAAYDAIAGILKLDGNRDLAERIFNKLFPKLSIKAVYAHII